MRRSDCPISNVLDHVGDRWSLLVIRDIALYGKRSFTELLDSAEHVATNVLTDRLRRLEQTGLLTRTRDSGDARKNIYRLTQRGRDLLPILIEMILWSARHDPQTNAPPELVRRAQTDRNALIADLQARIDAVDGR